MRYPFLGDDTRTYTQYRDVEADTPLVANPGRAYDMAPAGGLAMPVPPGDGLWGQPGSAARVPDPAPAPPPVPRTVPKPATAATDSTEGN